VLKVLLDLKMVVFVQTAHITMSNNVNVYHVAINVILVLNIQKIVVHVVKMVQKETHHHIAQLFHKESIPLMLKISQSVPFMYSIVIANVYTVLINLLTV
jgi:hypothetical protein